MKQKADRNENENERAMERKSGKERTRNEKKKNKNKQIYTDNRQWRQSTSNNNQKMQYVKRVER